MKVTTKGQVTIPQEIRDKFGITSNSEVDFFEEGNRIYIIKIDKPNKIKNKFRKYRGISNIKMTTDEIMSLTRDNK